MPRAIQIRNVPEEIHRTLKARAARAGMTLSEYPLRELDHVATRPTVEEILTRIRNRPRVRGNLDTAAAVRAEREGRR
ncbi:MAG: hypothetical protein HY720_20495 [Planctomycetes bacterium]|nr:hypothetical protein [Planctomycetota bacterium]